jgi:predicted phage terminase large subunit-like protein
MRSQDPALIEKFYELNKKTYLYMAVDDFDSYCIYLEWNREPQKRFYQPRRKVLWPLVKDLQDLADGKLDFLGVSLPPRVGKSTLCIFFMSWLMGKKPDIANVMSGHSDKLTDGFYREALSILTDKETYLWQDVFPSVRIVDNSAKNETIDLNRKKRFPTFTARSVGGTLTGAVEIGEGGCLYVDDLIEDLEEALNPDRLQAKYDAYLNQLKDRKKEGAIELMVGTRWGCGDPLGRVQEQYKDNPRYRFRVIPALNEKGESNFGYEYGVGFSTEYYRDMKASIDDATWWAKYMGNPYVREGLLFPREELRYYNGVLPDGEPYKVATCDVAWGGGDSVSMPFAYVFGSDIYIHDAVFNPGNKDVTQPVVIGRTKIHMPHKERFEANNGGGEYADKIDDSLRKEGVHINITARKAPNNQSKLGRIIQYSPDIKRFYFLKDGKDENGKPYRSKEYQAFMDELTTFSQTGKNPHDDAPDSLAMLADELLHGSARIEVGKRPW